MKMRWFEGCSVSVGLCWSFFLLLRSSLTLSSVGAVGRLGGSDSLAGSGVLFLEGL